METNSGTPTGTPAPAGEPAGTPTGGTPNSGNPAEQTPGTRIPEPAKATEAPENAPEGTPTTQEVTPAKESLGKEESKSALGQVHDLVKDAGLDIKEVAEVLRDNEGKLTPDVLLALQDKYGEGIAGLISDQLGNMYTKQVDAAKAKDKLVHDQVAEAFEGVTTQSGEETWKELAGWAKENVPNEDRKEINALLAQGGLAAKLAVQELCNAFKEHTGTAQTQDAQLMEADGVRNGDDRGLIDKVSYRAELDKLIAAGHDYSTSPEIKKLDARRMKSIKYGY
jgi:hypothetical protein